MPIHVKEVAPGIVSVTLDNVDRRNAMTMEMYRQLGELWPRLSEDNSCRVVLVRGEPAGGFCAGSDLSGGLVLEFPAAFDLIDAALLKTRFFPKPILCAVGGDCVGSGFELMLSSDIRFASRKARFGLPEVRSGLMAWGGGAMKLADQIGHAAAMDLLLSGRVIPSEEARAVGLITEVVADEILDEAAMARASAIAKNSPAAVRATKEAALQARYRRYGEMDNDERAIVERVRASGHSAIGIQAFREKRPPVFPNV